MKRILLISILGFAVVLLNAQIKVATNNNIGIGTSNPQSKLSVNTEGNSLYISSFQNSGANRVASFTLDGPTNSNYNISLLGNVKNFSTGFKNVAGYFTVYTSTVHSNRAIGVYGITGNGASGFNYGALGMILGNNNGAGIVGIEGGEVLVPGKFAGYFYGDVRIDNGILEIAGSTYTSDIRLKRNVVNLSSPDSTGLHTEKLKKLNAIQYQLVAPSESNFDTCKVNFNVGNEFLDRKHIGISAQEIQTVYPELVSSNEDGYLSVNYVGLIPILIEALKEQETEIELMKGQIKLLQEK